MLVFKPSLILDCPLQGYVVHSEKRWSLKLFTGLIPLRQWRIPIRKNLEAGKAGLCLLFEGGEVSEEMFLLFLVFFEFGRLGWDHYNSKRSNCHKNPEDYGWGWGIWGRDYDFIFLGY